MCADSQARRREDDISIVTGGIRVVLKPVLSSSSSDSSSSTSSMLQIGKDGHWEVSDASVAFGGMGPTTITCRHTMKALVGAKWEFASLPQVYAALALDMPLPASVPGGQPEYRRALPPSFFFKFFVKTCQELAIQVVSYYFYFVYILDTFCIIHVYILYALHIHFAVFI